MNIATSGKDTVPPAAASAPATGTPAVGPRVRDIRLDFFRGLAMFIILFAHTPGNYFTLWIPARWGFSDATEIFVFCSGMASAIAFGSTFDRAGWQLGAARVGYRVWQVYWAHVGLFVATVAVAIWLTSLPEAPRNYWQQLNLAPLLTESGRGSPAENLLGFMTLRYVPNYFDILPMYLVVLVLMPFVMAVSRIGRWAVAVFVIGIWLLAQGALLERLGLGTLHLSLPAEPWSERPWFFNPFGWQLVFFTGFAFMRGWLPRPPVAPWLVIAALVIVLANVPLSNIGVREFGFEWAREWRIEHRGWFNKTDFGLLRYVQFLALAYLMWVLAGENGKRLRAGAGALTPVWNRVVAFTLKVGQQSLAVFVTSMFLAVFLGFLLDVTDRTLAATFAVNFLGMAVLVVTAYTVAWFKAQPWRGKAMASGTG